MKKSLAAVLLLLSPLLLSAQNRFHIIGKGGRLPATAKAFLVYRDVDSTKTDSAFVRNGQFEFNGQTAEVVIAQLIMDYSGTGQAKLKRHKDETELYLVNGTTAIQLTDSLYNASISGTEINEDYLKYRELMRLMDVKVNNMSIALHESGWDLKEFQKRLNLINKERDSLSFDFVRKRPGHLISLVIMERVAETLTDKRQLQPLFDGLSASLKHSSRGKRFADLLGSLERTRIGDLAIDFTMNTPEGKSVKLSDFRGKYVLLDFWASWCAPCRKENPALIAAYNAYKNKGFSILSVSLDKDRARWLKAIKDDQLTWTQVSDLKYWQNEAASKYGIGQLPSNFLIDPEGKIIGTNLVLGRLETKLKEIAALQ